MDKRWPALEIHLPGCDPHLQDLVLAEIDDFEPTAIQELDDPPRLRAFFGSADSREGAFAALGRSFGSHLFAERMDVDDEDWAARSQAELRAISVGRITVAPPWDSPGQAGTESGGDAVVRIVIEPSMGFGTGHHATTRLALAALQRLEVRGRAVLDIGCGSGVLAIAAARLGARNAVALDVDPDALASAAENIRLNHVADRVHIQTGDFRAVPRRGDIVLANLTGALLLRSAAVLADCVAPGGSLVVSGFMQAEVEVVPALQRFLECREVTGEDEWRCALFSKNPSRCTAARR